MSKNVVQINNKTIVFEKDHLLYKQKNKLLIHLSVLNISEILDKIFTLRVSLLTTLYRDNTNYGVLRRLNATVNVKLPSKVHET